MCIKGGKNVECKNLTFLQGFSWEDEIAFISGVGYKGLYSVE